MDWVSFTFLATFVINNTLFAKITDFYFQAHKEQVKKDRHKQRKAIVEAFKLLDVNRSGRIDFPTWSCLFNHLHSIGVLKENDWNSCLLRFDLLDRDKNDFIDIVDFLFVESTINLRIYKREKCFLSQSPSCHNFSKMNGVWALLRIAREKVSKHEDLWRAAASTLIFVSFVNNLIWWRSMTLSDKEAMAWKAFGCSAACGVEVFLYVFFFNTSLRGTPLFRNSWPPVSPILEIDVVCAVCAIFFAFAVVLIGPSVPEVYRWLWISSWLNGIRVVRTSTRIGDIIEIMIEVTRFALPLVLGSLSVMHIYAYVGQRLFCRSNHFFGFHFTTSLSTMYSLVLGDDYHVVMDETIEDSAPPGKKSRIAHEYAYKTIFLSFHALFHYLILLVFMAVVTHAYMVLARHLKEANECINFDVELAENTTRIVQTRRDSTHSEVVQLGSKTAQLIHQRSSSILRSSVRTSITNEMKLAQKCALAITGEGGAESIRRPSSLDGQKCHYVIRQARESRMALLVELKDITDAELSKLEDETEVQILDKESKKQYELTRVLTPKEVKDAVTRFAQSAYTESSEEFETVPNPFKKMWSDAETKTRQYEFTQTKIPKLNGVKAVVRTIILLNRVRRPSVDPVMAAAATT